MTTTTEGGYYFQPHRCDTYAVYYIPTHGRDRRARFLGDNFPSEAAAVAAIRAARKAS